MLRTFSMRRIWFLPAAGCVLPASRIFLTLWFVSVLPLSAAGQTGTSAIGGLVRDESGGAVPGVVVHIVNEETGVAIDAVTNEEGLYRVTALVPGRYRVETMLDGFAPSIRTNVILQVSQTIAVDLTLSVASQTETVQVSASALAVRRDDLERHADGDARDARRRCRCRTARRRRWPRSRPAW